MTLWPGNTRARERLSETRLDYAAAALRGEDLNRGLELLQPEESSHQRLRTQLLEAREYRARRGRRERTLKRSLLWLGACTVMISLAAAAYSNQKRIDANVARSDAEISEKKALNQKQTAEKEKQTAEQ